MASERHIEVIARGVIRHGSHVLACQNVEGGYYYLPGGHVEFGEPAARALERELVEECGLRVRARGCVLVTEGFFTTRGKRHHEVNLVFHVEPEDAWAPDDPPPPVASREAGIEFAWLDVASMTDVDVRPEPIRAWLVSGGVTDPGAPHCGWVPAE